MDLMAYILAVKNAVKPTDDQVTAAVNEHLTEHPVTPGASEAEAKQISQNKTDISALKTTTEQQATDISSMKDTVNQHTTDISDLKSGKVSVSGWSAGKYLGTDGEGNVVELDAPAGGGGFSPTVEVSKSGKVTTITITDANGTKTAIINDGADGAGVESYSIPDFWADALNAVIATVKSLQTGKNCVTFAHFSDNHTRLGYSGMLIAEAMKKCNIPYCFYNGDSIDSGYISSESVMIAQEEAFEEMTSVIPEDQFCRSVGNHDGYWAISADEKYTYTRAQNYELFFRKQAAAQNKKFGIDGTYFYVDDLAGQIRFIVLNTNGGSVDDAQIAWFRDVALNVDEGFAVVVISHQPVSNHYHSNISNAAAVREIVADSGVEMIGWFSGHIHRDRIYTGAAVNTTDDTEGDAMGFTQVTITSDNTEIAYEDATMHTIADDAQSHAIDFVTINRETKTVNLTRLGIGNNRVYSYDNAVLYSVTNNLTNVVTNSTISCVEEGNGYSATLTVPDGYELSTVAVTMGGTDITETAYADGVISIAEVTGDIVITATATEVQTETASVPITWLEGKTCAYNIGSACTVSDNASYTITEKIPVEYGKTYTITFTGTSDGGKFYWVGIDENNIVTEKPQTDAWTTNVVVESYTPIETTKYVRLRGYTGSGMEAATELTIS